jgi:hypothetical protein
MRVAPSRRQKPSKAAQLAARDGRRRTRLKRLGLCAAPPEGCDAGTEAAGAAAGAGVGLEEVEVILLRL